jgi:tetratricopeptide (TPR) repeat protein
MGFSVQQAKRALANTATGVDVQVALESLLAGEGSGNPEDRGPSASDLERFREEDEAARREQEEAERRRRRRAGPSRNAVLEQSNEDSTRQLQEKADQLLAQASVFGANMFSRANALWKESKEKALKAYEEHAVGTTNTSSGRAMDNARPAWMRDEPPPSRGREHETSEHLRFQDDDIDPVLPPRPQVQQSRPAPTRQPSQPTLVTTAPPRPADKLASLFSDTTAYVSPSRRKPPQIPTPVQLSPSENRIASPPTPLRNRSNPPVSADILAAVRTYRAKGTEAFKLGQYGAAIDSYTAALGLLPEGHLIRIPLLNNRAAARSKTGDASGSIDDCTVVLEVIGDDFDPTREAPVADVDLSAAFLKALRRRAEMLESTEKWGRAREDWERLVTIGGAWAGNKASSDGVQGVGRCKRMEQGGSAAISPRASGTSTKLKLKPQSRPVPTRIPSSKPEDSAVHRLKVANAAAEAEGDQKHALKDSVDARIMAWKGGLFVVSRHVVAVLISATGKETNIRALIASLDTVLWPELGWAKVG